MRLRKKHLESFVWISLLSLLFVLIAKCNAHGILKKPYIWFIKLWNINAILTTQWFQSLIYLIELNVTLTRDQIPEWDGKFRFAHLWDKTELLTLQWTFLSIQVQPENIISFLDNFKVTDLMTKDIIFVPHEVSESWLTTPQKNIYTLQLQLCLSLKAFTN